MQGGDGKGELCRINELQRFVIVLTCRSMFLDFQTCRVNVHIARSWCGGAERWFV